MSKALIKKYRGWEIFFDTDREEFHAESAKFDNEKSKKSYSAIKKYIDDYIKANQDFKPVKFETHPTSYDRKPKTITIIGVRKDGFFIYRDENGEKHQLSEYYEKDYFCLDPKNDVIFKEMQQLLERRAEIDNSIRTLDQSLVKVSIRDMRTELLEQSNWQPTTNQI